MITTKDIVKGVNLLLKSKYPGQIYSIDDKKKIKKGSFRTETPFPIISPSSGFQIEEGTVRINYFPLNEDETRLEFLEKQAELIQLFRDGVPIGENCVIPVCEMDFEEHDNVLMMSFDYSLGQFVEETGDSSAEAMENLEIKEV